jgi:hypothetical protein
MAPLVLSEDKPPVADVLAAERHHIGAAHTGINQQREREPRLECEGRAVRMLLI